MVAKQILSSFVEIINKQPKDNEGCYLIECNGEQFIEPANAFEIIEKNIDDIYKLIVIEPDYTIEEGVPIFHVQQDMMGSEKSIDFLTSLGAKADEKATKIEECIGKLENPGDADINEIIWEFSQLTETDIF